MYKDKDKKGSGTTKQVGVKVELQNNSHSDVVVDTRETSKYVAEVPEVEQVTPKQALRGSTITIRGLHRYVPSLHTICC